MAHLALDAKSGRAMAIKQGCVNVSPCGGHGQDLVVAATKRSGMLASIIVSPQQPSPIRWVASDGWKLNLALVAAVVELWLSYCAACLLAQELLCSTKAADVSHKADGEAHCPWVCELLQLAVLKDFLFKAVKLLSAQVVQSSSSCSVLSALLCGCCSVLSTLLCGSLFCCNSSSCSNSSSSFSSSSPGRTQSCQTGW